LLIREKELELVLRLEPDVLLRGDASRFRQMVVNRLDTALKYTPLGRTIELVVAGTDATAFLEVTDSGIGIPPEALPYIFDRFYRVDKARSRETGGSGLGLSIVKAIASAYGAEVKVTSSPGRGTSVRVAAPRVPPSPEHPPELRPEAVVPAESAAPN